MKKILGVLSVFSFLFAFSPMPYNKIQQIAKEANVKLFGKYKKTIQTSYNIKNKTNINKVSGKPVTIEKRIIKQNKTLNISTGKKNTNITIKQKRNPVNLNGLLIVSKKKKNNLKILKLPYISFNDAVKQVIGAPNDFQNSLCRAILLEKEVVEPCTDVKKFIQERNKLLDEFASNLLKFKNDVIKNKAYYRGYFNCGLLYKYYSYEHYADCDKLMNMLSQKEKQQLYKYVNFVLNN